MRDFKTIVITGGPCAGKTTAIPAIDERLTSIGYTPIFIPETATEVIPTGITRINALKSLDFQTVIMQLQLKKEQLYQSIAKSYPNEKIVLICDRGALDNKAYLPEKNWFQLLKKLKLSENQLRDNYDSVFHMCSAAVGCPEFYTLENNAARTETLEQAIELDGKLINSWIGNPHLRIIDNKRTFSRKIQDVTSGILSFLGEPIPLEIEKKFLIRMPSQKLLSTFKKINIIQTYLTSTTIDAERRIRQRGDNLDFVYFYTEKRPTIISSQRIEVERRISKFEYLSLLIESDSSMRQVRKDRYYFVYNNLYFELDVYPFWDNYAVLEIELTNMNDEFEIPPFLDVIRDITDNDSFKNYNIAKRVPTI